MTKRNCGGPVIKEWPGFFLRDDTEIRRQAGTEPNEAYSLFQEQPYGRLHTFTGSKQFALEKANRKIVLMQDNILKRMP